MNRVRAALCAALLLYPQRRPIAQPAPGPPGPSRRRARRPGRNRGRGRPPHASDASRRDRERRHPALRALARRQRRPAQGKTDAAGTSASKASRTRPTSSTCRRAPGEIPFGTRFTFKTDEREHRIELALSDPTTDESSAAASQLDIRVERGCTHLRVSHRHEITNRGDRVVFIPEPERAHAKPLFEVELPEQADGFEAIAGGDGITRDGRRVRFWGPLYPGEQSVEFGYGLPLAARSFAIGFPSGAPPLAVLAPKGVVTVSSDALRAAPERAIDAQTFAALRGDPRSPRADRSRSRSPPRPRPRRRCACRAPSSGSSSTTPRSRSRSGSRSSPKAKAHRSCPRPRRCSAFRCRRTPASCASRPRRSRPGLRRDPSGDLAIHGPLPRGSTQLALSYRLPATAAARRSQRASTARSRCCPCWSPTTA
jgi:hypothetical protein